LFGFRELYWVERTRYYYVISQSIYSCNPESCSSRDKAAYIISWTNSSIIGLHVAIDCGTLPYMYLPQFMTECVF